MLRFNAQVQCRAQLLRATEVRTAYRTSVLLFLHLMTKSAAGKESTAKAASANLPAEIGGQWNQRLLQEMERWSCLPLPGSTYKVPALTL